MKASKRTIVWKVVVWVELVLGLHPLLEAESDLCFDEDMPRTGGRCLLSRGMCAKAGVCARMCVCSCVCSSEYELTLTHSQVESLIFAFDLQFYDYEITPFAVSSFKFLLLSIHSRSFTYLLAYLLTCLLTYSLTYLLPHLLTSSFTHSHTRTHARTERTHTYKYTY